MDYGFNWIFVGEFRGVQTDMNARRNTLAEFVDGIRRWIITLAESI
jgi:hypothetical protein